MKSKFTAIQAMLMAGLLLSLPWATQAAQQYTVTILTHPTGIVSAQAYRIAGGQEVGFGFTTNFHERALLWLGTASVVDLTPSGFTDSSADGTDGSQQVGYGISNGVFHALLWSGTAASVVDLHPSGFDESLASSISGSQQVGQGYIGNFVTSHALLWSGTAGSVVDLNPGEFPQSLALDISGNQQVGWGIDTNGNNHALLWSGTAASVVNLEPSGFVQSQARGIYGNQQVGWGMDTNGIGHALLWSGTATNVVDLNPSGFIQATGLGIAGNQQVGYAFTNSGNSGFGFAMVWSGTAASAVPLYSLLPTNYASSVAAGIDMQGNIVGQAFNTVTHNEDAILWTPINTSAGTNVVVVPTDATTGTTPVTLTFSNITQAGNTTLTTSNAAPALPAGFSLGTPPVFYDLSTTAIYSGPILICINYSGISFTDASNLKLLHFEGGVWVDHTVSLDTVNSNICGTVTSLSPFAIVQPPSSTGKCPQPQGYWKSNPNNWPVNSLTLGSQTYTKTELLKLLGAPGGGDASQILAVQLIAAKLNIANGSDPSPVSATISHADGLLSGFNGKLPYKVKTNTTAGKTMLNDATVLDNYNNRQLTPGCTP